MNNAFCTSGAEIFSAACGRGGACGGRGRSGVLSQPDKPHASNTINSDFPLQNDDMEGQLLYFFIAALSNQVM
jgi:hypothetical protein